MKMSFFGSEFTFCDALVDQKRYIGDDPVGFRCGNHFPAYNACDECSKIIEVTIRGTKRDLCERCFEILKSEPSRISFGENL